MSDWLFTNVTTKRSLLELFEAWRGCEAISFALVHGTASGLLSGGNYGVLVLRRDIF